MSAQAHPFAAVLGCWDRDADCIYIVHAIRLRQALPVSHVAAIKGHVCWDAPVAWPHDGGHTGFESTETFAATYKRLGLNMRPMHATFPRGGYNFESGITEIEQRLATGRLKIASHLAEIFDEYRGYHRVAGLVHKVDDDLLSAIRVLVMDIRYAKALAPERPGHGFRRPDTSTTPRTSTSTCSPATPTRRQRLQAFASAPKPLAFSFQISVHVHDEFQRSCSRPKPQFYA
jgi:Terminase RNaseH-like domain